MSSCLLATDRDGKQLLIALFSVPSARRFCDQLQYNMLFKWFLDLNIDDEPFHASSFSKNQERLLSNDVARRFLKRNQMWAEMAVAAYNLVRMAHLAPA